MLLLPFNELSVWSLKLFFLIWGIITSRLTPQTILVAMSAVAYSLTQKIDRCSMNGIKIRFLVFFLSLKVAAFLSGEAVLL